VFDKLILAMLKCRCDDVLLPCAFSLSVIKAVTGALLKANDLTALTYLINLSAHYAARYYDQTTGCLIQFQGYTYHQY
jgi:hypothetical protein